MNPALVKAAVAIGVLWWLSRSTPARANDTTDPFANFPHATGDEPSDVGVDTGGNVTILSGECTAGCEGTHFDCPGDPECP